MVNFQNYNPTRIVFGKGVQRETGRWAAGYGKKVLLHTGGKSIKASGVYGQIMQSLLEAGLEVVELPGVQPNPRLSLVREGIRLCRENGVELIVAAGGGSVIDSAKAIAAGVKYEGDVWDFYTGKARATEALPIGVVLTIPAAGSESSDSTVITNEEGPDKRSFGNEVVYPRFALLNPELCFTLPAYQIAAGGSDMLAHALERYFSPTSNTDFSDRLLEGTMKAIVSNVPRVLAAPKSYDAWAEVMWSGSVVHNGMLGRGRQEDWASHEIEHSLSAVYDIAHGVGLAIVFPAWMKYVYKERLYRFVQYAITVFGVDLPMEDPERVALEGIHRTERWFASLGLPTTLSGAGIPFDQFQLMAEKATVNGPLGAFKKLDTADVVKIYELAK